MDIYTDARTYLTTHGVSVSEDRSDDPDDGEVFSEDPSSLRSDPGDTRTPSPGGDSTPSPHFGPLTPGEDGSVKQLQRRAMVLSKLLENERVYVSELECLLVPLRPLKAAAYTSQPVLTNQEIQTIFYKLQELYAMHQEFHSGLRERIEKGQEPQTVADLFQRLVNQFGVYRAFVDNYPVAQEMVEKCIHGKEQFKHIAENMCLKNTKESKGPPVTRSLDVLLHKPVNHVTRITLLMRELLNNTPRQHLDYCSLESALHVCNTFLNATNKTLHPKTAHRKSNSAKTQSLVKDAYVVEVSDNTRKLRHIFLSPELFICGKLKRQPGRQPQVKCEWYLPVEELTLQTPSEMQLMDRGRLHTTNPQDIEGAHARLTQTKIELYLEKRQKHSLDRLRRNLHEIETWILLNSPAIPLGIQSRNGKEYVFLLSSEYDLYDWREKINRVKNSSLQRCSLTPCETQTLINAYMSQPSVREIPLYSPIEESEESVLRGILGLKIHTVTGFAKPLNVYCCLEVDCYGYFEKKAQTSILSEDRFPSWEEEVEVHLDGSHWLRLLLWEPHDYRMTNQDPLGGDRLLNSSQIQLNSERFQRKEWTEHTLDLNGCQLVCSVRFLRQSLSQLEELSGAPTGYYGVPISIVTYRDRSRVPLVVRYCAEEVERRGLKEVGIYRVSGMSTDIQALKAAIDGNMKDAVIRLKDYDIHVVAGALKLYLRELPIPLLTHELIPSFVTATAQQDPTEKQKQMTSLLQQLPEANYSTFVYIIEHLRRVSQYEELNKMSLHNLATVFGPSMLHTQHQGLPMDVSQEIVTQVQVVQYFLSDEKLSQFEQQKSVSVAT